MKLLTYKNIEEYTFYWDKNGQRILHGEYKDWRTDGSLWEHSFRYHGKTHGEYKIWNSSGKLTRHGFFINGDYHPYFEMDDQEKLLFQIKHPGFRFIEE